MKHRLSVLIAVLLFAITCGAQQPFTNVIKFYIHPDLSPDVSVIKNDLVEYVNDMNYILAKNTQHQLSYNPNTGCVVSAGPPFNGMELNSPRTNYEIRVWIRYSPFGYSYGEGEVSYDWPSGAAGITSLFWMGVWDADNIPNYIDFIDYRQQLIALLHGYGRIFGANMEAWDIYSYMGNLTDNTGVAPQKNIQMVNPQTLVWNYNDVYWGGVNADFYGDPAIGAFECTNRAAMLSLHRFSALSSKMIRDNYRYPSAKPPIASQNGIQFKVLDVRTCSPLEGVRVRIWRLNNSLPTALLVDTVTGTNGLVNWNWQSATPNYYGDSVRMVKCTRPGFPTNVFVLTTLDLQSAAMFYGQTNLSLEVLMLRQKLSLSIAKSNRRVTITNVTPGRPFALQASTNLNSGWTTITNYNPTTTANIIYNHPAGAPPVRFYRTSEYAECPVFEQMMAPQQEMLQAAPVARRPFVKKEWPMPPLPPLPSKWKTK